MVKVSEKKLLERKVKRILRRAVYYSDSSDAEEFSCTLAALESSRYLYRPVAYLAQHNCTILRALLDQRRDFFRHQTRMCQETFLSLLDLICDDPVFHNNSRCLQRHAGLQLYVYLQAMGHDGNGLTTVSISGTTGMGLGTVTLYSKRVTTAILRLRYKYVKWPNARARKAMSARFYEHYGFYAVGILDGTFVYFNQAPAVDPQNFFTRKRKMYGLNCQLICDLDWQIIGYVLGWPGCTPDTTAYETSHFFLEHERFFTPGQCVLADKGYTPRLTVCVPFDVPETIDTEDSTMEQKQQYNDGLKRGRLLIERVNAMLKNRFTWLKGMRFPVKASADFEICNRSIEAIIVLHNFMMSVSINDIWSDARRPECDEWATQLEKHQAALARATAKATAAVRSTQRQAELLSRLERMSQFLLWNDVDKYVL
jgi:hypothetical protein